MTEPKEANEGLYVTCRHCASSFCAFTGECNATGAKLPRKLTPHEKAVREGRDAATLAAENAALREKMAVRDALLRDAGALIQAFARERYLSNKIIHCDTDRAISMRETLTQIDALTGGNNAQR